MQTDVAQALKVFQETARDFARGSEFLRQFLVRYLQVCGFALVEELVEQMCEAQVQALKGHPAHEVRQVAQPLCEGSEEGSAKPFRVGERLAEAVQRDADDV